MDPRVEAICLSEKKGIPKTPVGSARCSKDHGLDGDAHAGPGHRQVSLLGQADIELFKQAGRLALAPGAFAENMVLSGIDLASLGLGSQLRLGKEALLTITQLGKRCHHRCAIHDQTGDCIMPRLGLFARVLASGSVAVGDPVQIVQHVDRAAFQVVVLTLSDRGSRGEIEDTAGPASAELVKGAMPAHVYRMEILPDDRSQLAARLCHYADGHSIDLILAVGGTGFSPRDVTPEAVRDVVERATPGLDEAMRMASRATTPWAMLSRAYSGIRGQTLIISLPGSLRAASENLRAILPALPHGLTKLRGDRSDCAPVSTPRSTPGSTR